MPHPGGHLEANDIPLANQTAIDALDGLHALGKGIASAADDKAQEYAQRILTGEDPKTMRIPKAFHKQVEGYVNAGRAPVENDETPGVGSAGRFDMGFDDNEDDETAIENLSAPETPESHTHTHLDLLS